MCKHILNAQVSVRAPCCKKWFDCPQCHEDVSDHELGKTTEMVFACKKCKKVFRKDVGQFEESDEYCPNCDNHFIIEAKEPEGPKMMLQFEGATQDMLRDERERPRHQQQNAEIMSRLGFR
ncbi:hypothetical protein PROFUN_00926 [Planoprotostelium fungivorum]|uniref:CHY-type domain-containing protein n=1 Tax=Planoprotostelium fungivorum TaxID=1890364 RepID=A0A2P6N488_9EUKA|nr:hypothetical protein PROFUN_00926 [Planoprotostelium fungivorum]